MTMNTHGEKLTHFELDLLAFLKEDLNAIAFLKDAANDKDPGEFHRAVSWVVEARSDIDGSTSCFVEPTSGD